ATAVVLVAGLVIGLVLAFGGSPPRHAALVSPSPTPSPSHSRGPLRSPFTGERVKSLHRVLAVKIDNYVLARPQTGLGKADLVYVLPVEGGLTRFMAIFSSHFPSVVGPVRSAREDDLALLKQFGRPALAYSGATPVLLPYIARHARIVNLYAGRVGGYYRDNRRIAPYNLYARTRRLLAEARHASKAHWIGFRFGPPPAGGHHTVSRSASFPSATYRFTWSSKRGRWLVRIDGKRARTTSGRQLGPATVVIQHTRITTSRFLEYGSRPPTPCPPGTAARPCCAAGASTGRAGPARTCPAAPPSPPGPGSRCGSPAARSGSCWSAKDPSPGPLAGWFRRHRPRRVR
ncbi:MAG: DUF3048 domain-containing protein, partial [Actinobacteria bacterium]|nr:DUF3048 domain-containing protein [Actinomycetota bacterium]